MASMERLNTHQKALRINLDPTSFGSFAEIGAGQEVVRWFLVVGGASGTVAKSISAYDKEVSDGLYGAGARYVSGERLQAMLDSEWAQLINQLNKSRGSNARFVFLLTPSPPATTREQMSLTVGLACGSNNNPAANLTTLFYISTCGILPTPSNKRLSASWV